MNNQINSGAEVDLMLLKNPNKYDFAQEQKEDVSLGGCFEAARTPTVLSSECPERFCMDKDLLYRDLFHTEEKENPKNNYWSQVNTGRKS